MTSAVVGRSLQRPLGPKTLSMAITLWRTTPLAMARRDDKR
jgi:hypothetical protein